MSKTPTIIILLLLLTIGLSIGAIHKYETDRPVKAAKVVNYQSLYNTASKQLTTTTTANGTLQAEVNQLTVQKTALCGDLSKAKLTDPLCN